MINDALTKADSINSNNTRIYYLRGILKYNMPATMGGGVNEGMKLFKLAMEKYESYKPTDEFAPTWGKYKVEKYLAKSK